MLYNIEELNFVENFAKSLANYFKSTKNFTVIYEYNYQYLPSTIDFKLFKFLYDDEVRSVRIDSVIRIYISNRFKKKFHIDKIKIWVIKEIRNKIEKICFNKDMDYENNIESIVFDVSDSEEIGIDLTFEIEKMIKAIDVNLKSEVKELLELTKNNEGIGI